MLDTFLRAVVVVVVVAVAAEQLQHTDREACRCTMTPATTRSQVSSSKRANAFHFCYAFSSIAALS